MVLSSSNKSLTGLWMASGVLPFIIWLTLISGVSTCSLGNTLLAASQTDSMKWGWLIVISLSLLNTGTMQSFFRCSMVTSFVLASMKGSLFTSLLDKTGSTSIISCCWDNSNVLFTLLG